jgi:hypoxanthine phosphoribosyltransferase
MTPTIKPLFSAGVIRTRIGELGAKIQSDLRREDPLVVSILGGSVIFLADLIRVLTDPLRFEFVQVDYSARGDGQVLEIQYPIPIDVEGQSLLVLKDVVASGVTETYLASQFRERGASAVRFAALIDLPGERKLEFKVDYPLFPVDRRGTFVGYGLKRDGRYGSLPYIALVEAEATA